MTEYIERETVVERLRLDYCRGCYNNGNDIKCRSCWVDDAIGEIEEAPAADVKEVRRGRWMGLHDGWHYSYSCSECGAEALTKEETMHDQVCSNYCPYCGARMDGKGDV